MRRRVYDERAVAAMREKDLLSVASAFDGFSPGAEVFTRVEAVPTRFVQFDHGVRVNGWPTQRIALIHGPSGQGKTYFTLGIADSFLEVQNPVYFVDAERTLEAGFVRLALKHNADSPLWRGSRPTTYEQTRVDVRKYCNVVGDLRAKGKIHKQACGLVVVDSIRKLVPKDQWDKMLALEKEGKDSKTEKARDRAAQHKAQMNAAWCDELIPLLEQTNCTMAIIAREIVDPGSSGSKFGPTYVTGGGSALYYDAALDIRVDRARYVTKEAAKKGGEEQTLRPTVYGERHRITIKKSKVSGKEDKSIVCFFHSSNGRLIPEGFDRARDVLELARTLKIVKGTSWLAWGRQKWQGEHAAVKRLTSEPESLARLEAEVRAQFRNLAPTEAA